MITVAIIGILSAIALPAYQNYVAASLAEITPGKTAYEVKVNEGKGNPLTVADIGLKEDGGACTNVAVVGWDGTTGSISCAIQVKGLSKLIGWRRDSNGSWSCSTTADAQYAPKGCSSASGDGDTPDGLDELVDAGPDILTEGGNTKDVDDIAGQYDVMPNPPPIPAD